MSAEAMEYLRKLVENSAMAIALTDGDGNLVVFNQGAEQLTGYRRHEVLGKPGSMLYWEKRVVADIVRAVESSDLVREQEVLIKTRDGSPKPVALLVSRLRDEQGKIIGNLGIAVDLTERKALQNQVEKATARARLFNDLLCQNIRRYALRIVERLDALAALPGLTQRQSKAVDLCRRQARRMETLAQQVESLTGLGGPSEVILNPIPARDLLANSVQGVLEAHSHRKVSVEMQVVEDCRLLVCDIFGQVIHNIVNNAVVHNNEERPRIWIRVERFDRGGEGWCRLSIEDDGPGIPDEHKESVFERFMKLQKSGSGVGLSVVRFLVERCGGNVHVEDRVPGDYSKGARFVLELHALDPASNSVARADVVGAGTAEPGGDLRENP